MAPRRPSFWRLVEGECVRYGAALLTLSAAVLLVGVFFISAVRADAKPNPYTKERYRPASEATVTWALDWRDQAVREWKRWTRARRCFDFPKVAFAGRAAPTRWVPHGLWSAAGYSWRALAREYRARADRLRHRMTHPGGGGAERWRPLVRWHWPPELVDTAIYVISLESGGCPAARNGSSGAGGLFQLLPAPAGWANPDYNVWYAYHRKYLPAGGWSPRAACGI